MTTNKTQLKVSADRLHAMKLSIGKLTYGELSRGKYVLNDLTRKIANTIDFLRKIDLPSDLGEDRKQVLDKIEISFVAIKQEYAAQKPNSKGDEFVTEIIDKHSDEIRQALGRFDGMISQWLGE